MNFLNKTVSRLHTRQQLIHFYIYFFVQFEENINFYTVSILQEPCISIFAFSLTAIEICNHTGIIGIKLDEKNAEMKFHSNLHPPSHRKCLNRDNGELSRGRMSFVFL